MELRFDEMIAQLRAQALLRAVEDEDFREALRRDPRTALESAFEIDIPPNVKFEVREGVPDQYIIDLPTRMPVKPDGELSDDDLEAVAGGSTKQRDLNRVSSVGQAALIGFVWAGKTMESKSDKSTYGIDGTEGGKKTVNQINRICWSVVYAF